ncbi:MAG TPA: C40 family peptidase [Chthonomonadaceae bacterium]|nr:C40 family peptidase [Chthonomonadaceae bacterium]
MFRHGALSALVVAAVLAAGRAAAQEKAPPAPDAPPKFSSYAVDWPRFDRLAEIARGTPATERLSDIARALLAAVPPEAGRLTPLDRFCLGAAWSAAHRPPAKGRVYYRDMSGLEGEELYGLERKGYRIAGEQAARIDARLITMLGVPSEVMTGLVRDSGVDRGAWVLSQVGTTWLRVDLPRSLPPPAGPWRPAAAWFQSSSDLDGVLAFLRAHLPDGELSARQQGLKRPLSLPEWQQWDRSEAAVRAGAAQGGESALFASRTGLFTPNPVGDISVQYDAPPPPTPLSISMLERLRAKPCRATRGERLADTARKFVGMPYIWGGEDPGSGFDCSGLMQYVCRVWGIHLPRTAAEQYHYGRPVSFLDLEPGDLIFLANTYKPGVSHVGMYVGDGQWVQAQGAATGIIVCDVPYFDANTGPGARRLDLSRLPPAGGEPAAAKPASRSLLASRHATTPRASAAGDSARSAPPRGSASSSGPAHPPTTEIVSVRVCGDTGAIANSGCTSYTLMRVPRSQLRAMRHCHKHHPLPGERG